MAATTPIPIHARDRARSADVRDRDDAQADDRCPHRRPHDGRDSPAVVEPTEDRDRRGPVVRLIETTGDALDDERRTEEHDREAHRRDPERARAGSRGEPGDADCDEQRRCDVEVAPVDDEVAPVAVGEERNGNREEESDHDDDHRRRHPAFGVRSGASPCEEHERNHADACQSSGRHELIPRLTRARDERLLHAVRREQRRNLGRCVDATVAVPDRLVELVVEDLARVRDHRERRDGHVRRGFPAVPHQVHGQHHDERDHRQQRPAMDGHEIAAHRAGDDGARDDRTGRGVGAGAQEPHRGRERDEQRERERRLRPDESGVRDERGVEAGRARRENCDTPSGVEQPSAELRDENHAKRRRGRLVSRRSTSRDTPGSWRRGD